MFPAALFWLNVKNCVPKIEAMVDVGRNTSVLEKNMLLMEVLATMREHSQHGDQHHDPVVDFEAAAVLLRDEIEAELDEIRYSLFHACEAQASRVECALSIIQGALRLAACACRHDVRVLLKSGGGNAVDRGHDCFA